jgi:hypothetical protein
MDEDLHNMFAAQNAVLAEIRTDMALTKQTLSDPHSGVVGTLKAHVATSTSRADGLARDLANHIAQDARDNAAIANELVKTNTKADATDKKVNSIYDVLKQATRHPLFIAVVLAVILRGPDAGRFIYNVFSGSAQVSAQVQGRGK